jgi:hypothetical protein
MYIVALALWAAFLIAAVFYVGRARNPRIRPLAAYLIFVTIFTLASFAVFAAILFLLEALGQLGALDNPLAAAVSLVLMFIPAFLVARWQIRKPPPPPVRP